MKKIILKYKALFALLASSIFSIMQQILYAAAFTACDQL
jgi:hypothetical protein